MSPTWLTVVKQVPLNTTFFYPFVLPVRTSNLSTMQGMYRHIMATLTEALRAERPELLELLQSRLLPVLVACKEPLSTTLLAWAVFGVADVAPKQLEDVGLLMRLIANLFPSRRSGSSDQAGGVLHLFA
jgi:hypothetical protein